MYPISPNRQIPVNNSRSPMRIGPNLEASIIGNYQVPPPPGMKAILKPKYYEAIEVPAGSIPPPKQQSQQHQPSSTPQHNLTPSNHSLHQSVDPEIHKKINDLEQEVKHYKRLLSDQPQNSELEQLRNDKRNLENQIAHFSVINIKFIPFQESVKQLHQRTAEDYDNSYKQLQKENDEQKRLLTGQCEQYFSMYQKCQQEKEELFYKIRTLEQHLQKVTLLQNQMQDYEEKINHLLNEINNWKQKYNQLDEDRINQIDQIRDEYERIYNQQYETLKNKYSISILYVQSAEQKCRILEEEMDRNRQQLNEAIKEAEQWRGRFHQEDLDKLGYTQRISQLELTTLHQQKEIDRLTLQSLQKQQENESLKQRINQLEFNHISSLQPSLESELRRTKEQIESRNKELEDLRKRNQDLESYCIKMKEIEVEHDILKNKYNELDKNFQDVQKYRYMYDQLQLEAEGQKNKISKLETQVSDNKRNEYRLQQEIQRLNDLLHLKDEEMNKQINEYKRNMQQLQNQVNQFKEQYEKELSSVYNSRNRSEQEFRENLEKKFNIVKEELENLRKEREYLLQTCSQLSQTKVSLENKIVILSGEIQRLNQVIKAKFDEQQNLKENYRLLQQQLDQSQAQLEDQKKESEVWKSRSRDNMNFNSLPKSYTNKQLPLQSTESQRYPQQDQWS